MSGRPSRGAAEGRWIPWKADLYLAGLAAAAGLVVWLTLQRWSQPFEVNPVLWTELVLMAVVSLHFPLEVGHKVKLTMSMAIYFCALLVFPTPAALLAIAAAQVLGPASLLLRGRPQNKRSNPRVVLFNVFQLLAVFGIGSFTYHLFLPTEAPAPLDRVQNIWAVPFTGVVIYLVNSLAVSVMAAIQSGKSPAEIWLNDQRLDNLQYGALYLVGLVTALVAPRYAFSPLVMALPTILIYLSLKRTRELVDQTLAAVEAMADVVDMRDPYTFEHSRRVAQLAARLARRMGLPGEDVATVELAARVHDLGKIGIPDLVLRKAGPLDEEERRLMEQHPEIGYRILSRFPEYRKGRELVLAHHERFDGRGYPRGLCADEVSVGAHILAVADSFDAMTSERPYRGSLTAAEALAELRRGAGSQWHPRVVEAVGGLLGEVPAASPQPVAQPA